MTIQRWNDERIDDLATLVRANDQRIDNLDRMGEANLNTLSELSHRQERRRENNRAVYLMLGTIITTEAAQIILRIAGVT